jgi:hypothetical protein
MDTQVIELVGRNRLVNELLEGGIAASAIKTQNREGHLSKEARWVKPSALRILIC